MNFYFKHQIKINYFSWFICYTLLKISFVDSTFVWVNVKIFDTDIEFNIYRDILNAQDIILISFSRNLFLLPPFCFEYGFGLEPLACREGWLRRRSFGWSIKGLASQLVWQFKNILCSKVIGTERRLKALHRQKTKYSIFWVKQIFRVKQQTASQAHVTASKTTDSQSGTRNGE